MKKYAFICVLCSLFLVHSKAIAQADDFRGELIINCLSVFERPIQGLSIKNPKYSTVSISGIRYKNYLNEFVLLRAGYFYRAYHTTDNYFKIAKADRPTDKVVTQEIRLGAEIRIGSSRNFLQPYLGVDGYLNATNYDLALKTSTYVQKDRIKGWGISPILGFHINLSDAFVFSVDAAYNIGRESKISQIGTSSVPTETTTNYAHVSRIPVCGLGMGVRF